MSSTTCARVGLGQSRHRLRSALRARLVGQHCGSARAAAALRRATFPPSPLRARASRPPAHPLRGARGAASPCARFRLYRSLALLGRPCVLAPRAAQKACARFGLACGCAAPVLVLACSSAGNRSAGGRLCLRLSGIRRARGWHSTEAASASLRRAADGGSMPPKPLRCRSAVSPLGSARPKFTFFSLVVGFWLTTLTLFNGRWWLFSTGRSCQDVKESIFHALFGSQGSQTIGMYYSLCRHCL